MNKADNSKALRLMTLFTISALISMIAILSAIHVGTRTLYSRHIVDIATQQSTSIAQALFVQERDLLTSGVDETANTLGIAPEDFATVDRRMHEYLAPFGIVKIKVFDRDKRIVYSTDPAIIDQIDSDNARLETALAGGIDAELASKETIIDLAEEVRFDVDIVETYVPVTDDAGRILGSLEVYLDVTHHFDRLARILMTSALVIAAILLVAFGILYGIMRRGTRRLGVYERKLEAMASTDVLTGIPNRRSLLARADEELSRIRHTQQGVNQSGSLGCILIDLDLFKHINDTHGHDVGDEVLREVARRFGQCLRQYDMVGRYGGEEFLVLTPGSEAGDVKEIAERVWQQIRKRPFRVGGLRLIVTASIGYACLRSEDDSIGDLLKRADEALYRAKAEGRDRVAAAPSEVTV